ncbi:MAG: hypothetical protein AB1564_10895 [Chloroflexota bacterium]
MNRLRKLPLQNPFRVALRIYTRRLLSLVVVILINLLFLTMLFLLSQFSIKSTSIYIVLIVLLFVAFVYETWSSLRQWQTAEILTPLFSTKYSGLTFAEMYDILNKRNLSQEEVSFFDQNTLNELTKIFGDKEPSVLHVFWILSGRLQNPRGMVENYKVSRVLQILSETGLVQSQKISGTNYFQITEEGRKYLLSLKAERKLEEAEKYIIP